MTCSDVEPQRSESVTYGESLPAMVRRQQDEAREAFQELYSLPDPYIGRVKMQRIVRTYGDIGPRVSAEIVRRAFNRINQRRNDPMQIDIHICAISNGFLVTMPTYGATEDTVAALYEDRGNLSHFFPTFDAVCDGLPALAEKAKADHEAHRAKLAEEHKRWEEDKKRYTDDAKQPGQVQSGGIAGYDHGKVPVSGTIYREPDSDDDNQTLRKLPEEVAAEQIEPIVQPAFTIGAEPVDDPIGDQFDEADRRPA